MALAPCRECKHEVSTDAPACPHCGAPRPWQANWKGWGFEWKSEWTMFGLPLIHIAFGRDARGRLRVAKGIVAIGQFGIGIVTVAQLGLGVIGLGQLIGGVVVLAQVAVALHTGVGQFATGYTAVGQIAVGYYVYGQIGAGQFVWSAGREDAEAVIYFKRLAERWWGAFLGGSGGFA